MELNEKDLIEKYLHGELADPELEGFEERFFLEPELFERIETAEMLLVDRYVRKGMSGGEIERFEKGYLTSPERRAGVQEAARFHTALERSQAKAAAASASEAEAVAEPVPFLERIREFFSFRLPVYQMAGVAAALVIVAGTVWIVLRDGSKDVADLKNINFNIDRPRNSNDSNLPGKEAAARLKPKLHKGDRTNIDTKGLESVTVRLAGAEGLRLTLSLPDEIKGETYVITVRDSAGKEILTRRYSREPEQDDQGRRIPLALPAKTLPPGQYTVLVNTEKDAENTAVYQLEVQR